MPDQLESPQPDAGVPEPEPWDRRRDRRAAALLFLIVGVVYLATATYSFVQVNDTRATAIAAWSLGTQGSLALPEVWAQEDTAIDWVREGADGNSYVARFPGAILWATPFYALAGLIGDTEVPEHPWLITFVPAGIAAATAAALAITLSFVLYRRLVDRRTAVAAAGVMALGTSVWSVSADALWNHGFTHLWIVVGLLYLTDDKPARGGLALAASVISRPQTAVVAAVLGIARAWERRSVRTLVIVGATSALGAVAMAVYTRAVFGTWVPTAGYGTSGVERVASTSGMAMGVRAWGMLFDGERGALLYTPVLLLGLAGGAVAWRRVPAWVRASAVAGVVYLAVQLRANGFDGGFHFFGPRLFIETLVLLSPLVVAGYALWIRGSKPRRLAFNALIGISVVIHGLGATVLTYSTDAERFLVERLAERCEELGVASDDC